MRTLIAAIGAMALATGADAQTLSRPAAGNDRAGVGAAEAVGDGQKTYSARARSVALDPGAGASRSSDANQG